MKVVVLNTYEELSEYAALMIKSLIERKRNSVLGLATGSTPIGLYRCLTAYHQNEKLDFSNIITFNLDEYVGVYPSDPESYHYFMNHHFFRYINLKKENINIPCGHATNLDEECNQYEKAIDHAGGIDIQILGIGSNGHIGFNEPGSKMDTLTRVVNLDDSTRRANARFFKQNQIVPKQAVSMGIKTIIEKSKRILLMAHGLEKANAIKRTIVGRPSPEVPASFLQYHSDVTILLDTKAASELDNTFFHLEKKSS